MKIDGPFGIKLNSGDVYVAVTDGIGDVMTDTEIRNCIYGKTPKQGADNLMRLAESRPNNVFYDSKGPLPEGKVGTSFGKTDDRTVVVYKQP